MIQELSSESSVDSLSLVNLNLESRASS